MIVPFVLAATVVAQSSAAAASTAATAPTVATAATGRTDVPAAALGPTDKVYGYRFVPTQPAAPKPGSPQIFAVYLNDATLRSSGQIRIRVVTNSPVVKVTSRSNGRSGTVPMVAAGDFEANSVLPHIPFVASGVTTDLKFTATAKDGKTVTVGVPISLK